MLSQIWKTLFAHINAMKIQMIHTHLCGSRILYIWIFFLLHINSSYVNKSYSFFSLKNSCSQHQRRYFPTLCGDHIFLFALLMQTDFIVKHFQKVYHRSHQIAQICSFIFTPFSSKKGSSSNAHYLCLTRMRVVFILGRHQQLLFQSN